MVRAGPLELAQSTELVERPLRVVVPLRVAPEMVGPLDRTILPVPVCVGRSANTRERKVGAEEGGFVGPA